MIIRFIDFGGIVDNHCLNFLLKNYHVSIETD